MRHPTDTATVPLGPPRQHPYGLAFYGTPHCSPAFVSAMTGGTASSGAREWIPGRTREQALWMSRQGTA